MAKVRVNVTSGICGMETSIDAQCDDLQTVCVDIKSNCTYISDMAEDLRQVDAMKELFSGFGEGKTYDSARKNINHAACPVPAAILKAIEAASEMALKKDVHILFE